MNRSIVITQPTFLPWLGYFSCAQSCDVFVFLDNVQFQRRSWHTRNRIVSRTGDLQFVNLPVTKASRDTKICDMRISDSFDVNALIDKVMSTYIGTEYVQDTCNFLKELIQSHCYPGARLSKANAGLFMEVCGLAGIQAEFFYSSEIEKELSFETPTQRLLEICKLFGGTKYLSAMGSRDYMLPELSIFADEDIDVEWLSFRVIDYVGNERFVSHLSFIDFLMHNRISFMPSFVENSGTFLSETVLSKC